MPSKGDTALVAEVVSLPLILNANASHTSRKISITTSGRLIFSRSCGVPERQQEMRVVEVLDREIVRASVQSIQMVMINDRACIFFLPEELLFVHVNERSGGHEKW